MADGSVVFSIEADDVDAQKKLTALRKEIEKTQKDLASKEETRSGIAESLSQAREEAEKTAQSIRELKDQMSENARALSGQEGGVDVEEFNARSQAQKEMSYELDQQTKLYQKQSSEVSKLEAKEQGLTKQIEQQTEKLEKQKGEYGEVGKQLATQVSSAAPKASAAINQVSTSIKKGFKNILKWGLGIRSVFVLINKLRNAIKEGINDYAKVDPSTKKNLDDMKVALNGVKASFGAAFAPVLNVVLPILQKLCSWLQTAIEYIGMFFSALSGGKTYKKAIANNNALADSYGSAGAAAKDAKKQLMGFDEINKLNDDSSGGGGGGGGASMPMADYVDEDIPNKFQNVVQVIKDNIAIIESVVGTAFVAIGAILLFTWAAPLIGLGLIIAGIAMQRDVVMNWGALPGEMQNMISIIMGIVALALIVFGAVFLFTGNVPVGLGLLLAGGIAAGINIALNFDAIKKYISDNATAIRLILAGSLLVIGAILAFAGVSLPIGIALMAAGAGSLIGEAVSAIDWDSIKKELEGPVGGIVAIVSGALLAVGAILAFSGVALPLGIAIMAAGAASLATVTALNWDKIQSELEGPLGLIATLAGGALLVLGLVLAFSGAALPLGLGLIVAGAGSLGVGALNYDWGTLKNKISDAWRDIKLWWNTYVAKYFTISYWQDKLTSLIDNIKLPSIKLPHFTVTWEPAQGWMADVLDFFGIPAQIPHIDVAWYAKGGIVDGATMIGAGEAGKEAIVPLEKNTEWIGLVSRGIIDGLTKNNDLADYISGRVLPSIVTGSVVPPRALSGGGSVFTDGDIQKLVSGIVEAFNADGNDHTTKLYLDGRQIAEVVTKHQRRMERGFA